jgi:hypothetical protein
MSAGYAAQGDIKVQVLTQDGESHSIEVPSDMRVSDILTEIIEGLNLPTSDANGNRVVYVLTHKEMGRDLVETSSLGDSGVETGNHLVLRRTVTAGSGRLP